MAHDKDNVAHHHDNDKAHYLDRDKGILHNDKAHHSDRDKKQIVIYYANYLLCVCNYQL